MYSRPSSRARESVAGDWRSPLPTEKSRVYMDAVERAEIGYGMFSVSLDEALGYRRSGKLQKAYQALGVAPALCLRFTTPLLHLLLSMTQHARHFGTTPTLAPLNPRNFQNARSQRVARMNGLFGRVLLSQRAQFNHKLVALAELVEDLGKSFCELVGDLGEEDCLDPDQHWEALDANHYDLNTCLREAVVLLKCFLHAIPEAQLEEFTISLQEKPEKVRQPRALPHLAHRRLTPLKGQ